MAKIIAQATRERVLIVADDWNGEPVAPAIIADPYGPPTETTPASSERYVEWEYLDEPTPIDDPPRLAELLAYDLRLARHVELVNNRDPDPTGADHTVDYMELALLSLPNRTKRKPPSAEFLKIFTPPPKRD